MAGAVGTAGVSYALVMLGCSGTTWGTATRSSLH